MTLMRRFLGRGDVVCAGSPPSCWQVVTIDAGSPILNDFRVSLHRSFEESTALGLRRSCVGEISLRCASFSAFCITYLGMHS